VATATSVPPLLMGMAVGEFSGGACRIIFGPISADVRDDVTTSRD
jgi:hypothetical protein